MVCIAVIGIGRIGSVHARNLKKGKVTGARLVAICDVQKQAYSTFCEKYGFIPCYEDYKLMLEEIKPRAVIIATEHYFHTEIAEYCIENGVDVLVEKPVGVTTEAVKKLIAVSKSHPEVKAAVMYNQRTNPLYARAKRLVKSGALGKVVRINYIITDWYRSQAYYNEGGWRASFCGEGGGALINQCIHQLDLLQWIAGMPKSVWVRAFTKNRNITVENDVTALFRYEDDVFCSFSASTHELRGTNRLEIAGDKGRIVIDGLRMKYYAFAKSEGEINASTQNGYGAVQRKTLRYSYFRFKFVARLGEQRKLIQNFVNSLNNNSPLLSPLTDGLNAVELINAAYLSAWENKEIAIPIDDRNYVDMLSSKIAEEKL
ncbi:MAG: Gfo/Idh/MocA family oxidoreductase [Clostridia bacterium]|nr:Gfo/Idh/MocA family oxidoreductase [Clostridia bacterium]